MCYDLHPHCHRTCKNSASEGEKPCAEKKKMAVFHLSVHQHVSSL